MSHNVIRKDKTCLNCRHVVQERFCPNCGQENIENRKTFHQLFVHFFEDLTHYENAFWRTIKNLLLKPAALTKEYLSGKRLSYLAPVRLYIFISFITFFLIAVWPDGNQDLIDVKEPTTDAAAITARQNKKVDDLFDVGFKSKKQVDSTQQYAPKEDRLDPVAYWVVVKVLEVKSKNTNDEILKKFKKSFVQNFSKTLFIYMPLFAFFLWLFHNKKRWYYFDHGIFTLHYFSFLLLVALIVFLLSKFLSLFGTSTIATSIETAIDYASFIWMFYYFFPAHHRFYGETRLISFVKSISLFFINMLLIIFIITFFALYTFINIH